MIATDQAADFTVAEALRRFAPAYLAKYGHRMPPHHRKVLGLILRCKTGELGGVRYRCAKCDHHHWVARSCGNRHCPNCQKHKTQNWLAKQTRRLLPVQYFVVTFTVPSELRPLLRANPEAGYEAIFAAGSQTIRALLAKPRNLGSQSIGFFGVLHTWGRDLNSYNPHVHFVVVGGGVSPDGSKWLQAKRDFLFHHEPARQLYKKRFVESIRKADLYENLPRDVLKLDWVVNIKPVGDGNAVLKYLAPYVYRVAISDNRITRVDDAGVTYRVKPSGKRSYKSRSLDGESFVRAFAQHILPAGFRKVRHYGFLASNHQRSLANIRWLVWLHQGWTLHLSSLIPQPSEPPTAKVPCRHCGNAMTVECLTDGKGRVIWHRVPVPNGRGPPPTATLKNDLKLVQPELTS